MLNIARSSKSGLNHAPVMRHTLRMASQCRHTTPRMALRSLNHHATPPTRTYTRAANLSKNNNNNNLHHHSQHKISTARSRFHPKYFQRRSFTSGGAVSLVVADHSGSKLDPSTLSTISAAQQLGGGVHVLLAGAEPAVAQQVAKVKGVTKVWVTEGNGYQHSVAENFAPLVVKLQKQLSSTHILSGASTFGKALMPRVAAMLDVSPISEIIKVVDASTFVRPIYAGNALATVRSNDSTKVVTVRGSSFDKAGEGSESAEISPLESEPEFAGTKWVSDDVQKGERPDLQSASVVISGGRGMQNGENFVLLEKLADLMGGAIGASRAAVDAGFVSNDLQVGQTGKIVAPDLYVAVGISGAIQHLAGMKDSKTIVAINKDPDAPIMSVADYAIKADLFQAVPELTDLIQKAKAK